MKDKDLAEQLLRASHAIACIHEVDVGDEFGITILFNDGASFCKPLGTKERCAEVWERLLKIRPQSLTEFGEVLFDPKDVKYVEIIKDEDGEAILIIEFVNHLYNNLIFYSRRYNNFVDSCVDLFDHLDDAQLERSRQSYCFFQSRAKH